MNKTHPLLRVRLSAGLDTDYIGNKMIKYRTYPPMEIKKREVIRETDKQLIYKFVWCGKESEAKEAKKSQYQNWFDTFDDARDFLLRQATNERDDLLKKLDYKQKDIEKLTNLKE